MEMPLIFLRSSSRFLSYGRKFASYPSRNSPSLRLGKIARGGLEGETLRIFQPNLLVLKASAHLALARPQRPHQDGSPAKVHIDVSLCFHQVFPMRINLFRLGTNPHR